MSRDCVCVHHNDDMLQPLPWETSLVQQWADLLSLLLASPTPHLCCRLLLTFPFQDRVKRRILFQIHQLQLVTACWPFFPSHSLTSSPTVFCRRCGHWLGWQPTWLFSGSPAESPKNTQDWSSCLLGVPSAKDVLASLKKTNPSMCVVSMKRDSDA